MVTYSVEIKTLMYIFKFLVKTYLQLFCGKENDGPYTKHCAIKQFFSFHLIWKRFLARDEKATSMPLKIIFYIIVNIILK